MPKNSLLGNWGQGNQGGGLQGASYSGAFGNSINSIPGIGGSLEGILGALYGNKPSTPSPVTTAGQAIRGNIRNLPDITSLALGTDAVSAAGARMPYELNIPNYDQLMSSASGNISNELNGQLPKDVQDRLAQAAAERGVSTGVGFDSPNAASAYLRALGLTSLDMNDRGQQDLSRLIAETPHGQLMNPEDMFVLPSDQQAAQLYANQIAAAPDPQAQGLMNTLTSFI